MGANDKSLFPPVIAAFVALAALFSLPYLISVAVSRENKAADTHTHAVAPTNTASALGGSLLFTDLEKQSREFIGYYHSIALTPEQEAIKAEVLKAMPAACCEGSTAYTCCCPCNLSKTLWGLSNYVIANRGANAEQLREVVYAWMSFTNPNGYSGKACYRGGCNGGFQTDGCGGMTESELAL